MQFTVKYMKIIADTHTHSIASGDAHCTISENIATAKKLGLKFLCLTDHVNIFSNGAKPAYFKSLCSIPRMFEGIHLVRGIETNVIDFTGHVDMPSEILDWLDWVIASMHSVILTPGTKKEHTNAWLGLAENPSIDVIGHCGDPKFAFEIDEVVKAFKKGGKIVEINNHSFGQRTGSKTICTEVAKKCMHYEVPIVVSSDAHFTTQLGLFDDAVRMLNEIGFPEELVLNADEQRFETVIHSKMTHKD